MSDALPVAYDPDTDDTGLGDFDSNVIPRLSIDAEGVFVNNLTNERHAELDVVILGVVKQRVLWPETMGSDGDKPLCRSINGVVGTAGPGRPDTPGIVTHADGTFACSTCPLAEWDSHPSRGVPWCSEQLVLPLLIDGAMPALLTVQRSALKSTNAYISDFKRRKTGAFTHFTKLTLSPMKRGKVDYSVPVFTKANPTDPSLHDGYLLQFRGIREFLTTPRSEDDTTSPAPATAPGPKPSASPEREPERVPVGVGAVVDAASSVIADEVPF